MFPAAHSKAWKQQRAAQRASSQLAFRHSAPESFTAEVDVPCIGANPRTVQVILPSRPGCLLRYSLDRVGSFKWVLWLRTWRKTIPNPCWCMIYHGFSHVISYFCLDTWFEVRLTWILLTFNLLNQTKTLSAALICYLMLGTTMGGGRGLMEKSPFVPYLDHW